MNAVSLCFISAASAWQNSSLGNDVNGANMTTAAALPPNALPVKASTMANLGAGGRGGGDGGGLGWPMFQALAGGDISRSLNIVRAR